MARDFGNYLTTPDGGALDITGPITIHAWVRPDSLGANSAYVSKYTSGLGNGQYLLRENTSRVGFFMLDASNNGHEGFSPASLQAGVWQSVAGRYRGPIGAGALRAYWNGISGTDDTMPSGNPNSGTEIRLGLTSNGLNQYDGLMAHVAFWNIDLTDQEILGLARGVDPQRIRPSNLIGYFPLDDYGPAGQAYDRTRNRTTFTMAGTVGYAPDNTPTLRTLHVGATETPADNSGIDSATIYIDIQVSSADIADTVDSATVLVDIQVSAVESAQFVDSATFLVDLQVASFECHIKWQPTFTGDFTQKWTGASSRKWARTMFAGWSGTLSYGTVADEC